VHVSALSHSFVKDPREVVKPGDIVKVKVLDVDVARKRISLTLRLDDDPVTGRTSNGGPGASGDRSRGPGAGRSGGRDGRPGAPAQGRGGQPGRGRQAEAPANSAMADALRRAGLT
jgi:uncharacterized protein